MAWIKRNLWMFVSSLIAAGLLGFGGWYLWQAMQQNAKTDNEIEANKKELERLMGFSPFSSQSNINQARHELDRINAFMAEARKAFPPTPPPTTKLTDQTFKSLLRTTIADLAKDAVSVGIKVETNYSFSFDNERDQVTFPPEVLQPLADQLHEVQEISSLLFKAKVNQVESVRRARVAGEVGTAGDKDYVSETPRTNSETGMLLWPYEVTFQSFSPELATLMENISRAPEAWVVRSVVVAPVETLKAQALPGPAAPAAPGRNIVPKATPQALQTLLEEKPLRVTLKLDLIKPVK